VQKVTEEIARWIDQARQGDESAYRELYRLFRSPVVRVLESFSSLDRDEVEDVVQETFTRAFKALPRLKANGAFESWLLSIARNRALSHLERRSTGDRARQELTWSEPESSDMLPEAFHAEVDGSVVRELIAALPEGPEKETVTLFYVEGELTAREIAERMGVGKSAVTMRLERFRARVKRELLVRLARARWE